MNVDDLAATRAYDASSQKRPAGPAFAGPAQSVKPGSLSALGGTIAMGASALVRPNELLPPPARPRSHSPYPAFRPSAEGERRIAEPQPEIEAVAPTMAMVHEMPPSLRMGALQPAPLPVAIPPLRQMGPQPYASPHASPEVTSMGSVLIVRQKSNRATFIVLGVVFLLLAAVVAVYFLRERGLV